jgi:hypothetical protein
MLHQPCCTHIPSARASVCLSESYSGTGEASSVILNDILHCLSASTPVQSVTIRVYSKSNKSKAHVSYAATEGKVGI